MSEPSESPGEIGGPHDATTPHAAAAGTLRACRSPCGPSRRSASACCDHARHLGLLAAGRTGSRCWLLGKGPASDPALWYGLLAVTALAFSAACLALGNLAERHFRRKDPGQVVADETAGMALTLLCLPHACTATTTRAVVWIGAAFILFRLADIIKPPPAHRLQSLHAGAGILVDDLLAGLYAGVLTGAAGWLLL
ncbi:MAG: phosphatidylglycerophosphatase A [Phycisphaeraceae bacterium]|nr:phosphatidylglycerophosphatase A [Phycisphaeraceae bacterium]